MNIGAVAKLTGLSSKSIRLYEDKGLITPPVRSESGYREYCEQQIKELKLISRAKNAGFSLEECKEFVELAQNPCRQSSEVKLKAKQKLLEVKAKISHLREMEKQLQDWVDTCPGDSGSECPIINDLTR